MTNSPAMGQLSTAASMVSVGMGASSPLPASGERGTTASAQSPAGVGEEEIDPAGVGDQMAVHGARALLLDVANEPLDIGEEAVDGAAEVWISAVALAHLIEAGAALRRID